MPRRLHMLTTDLASLMSRNGSKARSYTATTAVLHPHRPPSQVRTPSQQRREGAAPPSAAAKTGPTPPRVALESSAGADLRKLDSTERNGDSARVRVFGAFGFVWVRVCASALPRMHSLRPHVLRPSVRARANVHLHARTNVRRRAPGQVLSGTFGTHSPSQSTTGSPCGESSSSRVRRWLLARSTGFSILVLHMLTWCRRLSRSGCALCSVARAAVTAAERCGCRGGAVLYSTSGSSRLEHRRLFSTKPRATASCNAHA